MPIPNWYICYITPILRLRSIAKEVAERFKSQRRIRTLLLDKCLLDKNVEGFMNLNGAQRNGHDANIVVT